MAGSQLARNVLRVAGVALRATVLFFVYIIAVLISVAIVLFSILAVLGLISGANQGESAIGNVIDGAFPVNAIVFSAWSGWWLIPKIGARFRGRLKEVGAGPEAKLAVDFAEKSLRPLTFCIAIATTPHILFFILWSAVPADARTHSTLGFLLLGYERVVLNVHEWLKLYDKMGWLWWAAIVFAVGWIAVQFSRLWLLDLFLTVEHAVSRVAFTIGIAVYFTATTSVAVPVWDPNVHRHLEVVLRQKFNAQAVLEVSDAVQHAIEAHLHDVNAAQAVPAAIYIWSDADLEPPDARAVRKKFNAELENPALSSTGEVDSGTDLEVRRELEAIWEIRPPLRLTDRERGEIKIEEARELARERTEAILGDTKFTPLRPQGTPDIAPKDVVSTFQRVRNDNDILQQKAEIARTAAAQAFVKAAGVTFIDIPILTDLFKEMISATAEVISSRTIEQVPTNLILSGASDLHAAFSHLFQPDVWMQLAREMTGRSPTDPRFTVDATNQRILVRMRDDARKRVDFRIQLEESVRETAKKAVKEAR